MGTPGSRRGLGVDMSLPLSPTCLPATGEDVLVKDLEGV